MGEPCISCGADAILLCDYVLGFELGTTLPHPTIKDDGAMFTCDAPLCRGCARFAGNRFFDGSPEVTGVESVDYCPIHHDGKREGEPITASDADYLRRQAWATLRRKAMGTVSSLATASTQPPPSNAGDSGSIK